MPRPGPRRPQVAVRFTREMLAELDAILEQSDPHVTRSDLIRVAVRFWLANAIYASDRTRP